jgi:hypothetical protein
MRYLSPIRAVLAAVAAVTVTACGGSSPSSPPPPAASPPTANNPPNPGSPPVGQASAPAIVGFSLQPGLLLGEKLLVVVGGGFQTGASVTFNGVAATSVGVDPAGASIICVTPSQPPGSVTIVVTNPDGHSVTFTGSDTAAPPSVNGFGSSTGAPGSTFFFDGSGIVFPKVFFGTVEATIVSITARPPIQVTVQVPNIPSGTYEVVLVNSDGQFSTVWPIFVIP